MTSPLTRRSTIVAALLPVLVTGALWHGVHASATGPPAHPRFGAVAIPHREDVRQTGRPRRVNLTTAYIGHDAGEPTIGVGSRGIPFVAAAETSGGVPRADVMRGDRSGRDWKVVSPQLAGLNLHAETGDPYVFVDNYAKSSRLFTIDLQFFACSFLSFSDDGGESWVTNPFGCGRPVNDHQTLFSAPPVSSQTVDYPNVIYYCFHDVVSSACTKSLDGGVSFVPTGDETFVNTQENSSDFCDGLHGHGFGASDGTIYIPKVHCGEPMLAISKDEGATWSRVHVSDMPGAGHEASVATDAAGNIYYAFIGRNLLPYLATSTDGGKTWSRSHMIGAPGVREASLPSLAASHDGRVVVAYMGSESPQDTDAPKRTWNGYLTSSTDATSRSPHFLSVTVNPADDPLLRGQCPQTKCGPEYDFIDVVIDRRGTVWSAFVDGCMHLCVHGIQNDAAEGLVAKWESRPSR